jgi:hypothetical protein
VTGVVSLPARLSRLCGAVVKMRRSGKYDALKWKALREWKYAKEKQKEKKKQEDVLNFCKINARI